MGFAEHIWQISAEASRVHLNCQNQLEWPKYYPAMIPEPYELFDIDKGSDKLFLIGTSWIVLFLFLL